MGPVRVDAVCGSFSKFFVLIVLANVIGPGSLLASQVTANSSSSPQLPLLFEQNNGQFNDSVDYVARGKGYSIVLGQQPVIELYRFGSAAGAQGADLGENPVEGVRGSVEIESVARIRLNILGARADSAATPLERQQALTNYLTGDPSDWKTGIPNFTRVRYSGVLPDIDVEYYGRDGRLEYDFVVHPGGDPGSIKFSIEGAQGISVNEQHDLVIDLGGHHIVQRAPVSWQLASNGEKISIPSAYSVEGDVVRLEVAAWDADKILVIDPVLEYSAYYGGAANDEPLAIDLDSSGNIYVISQSRNNGLGTLGTLKPTNTSERVESIAEYNCGGGCSDSDAVSGWVDRRHLTKLFTSILVTKFSPDGKNVLFATYFNGNPAQDLSLGVNSAAVSAAGEVAFGIFTNNVALRAGLPTPNAAQAHSPSQQNVYVAKLNSTGTALVFGTYLQIGDTTSFNYFLRGLDVSAAGKVAVTGMSSFNSGFPELNPIAGQSCALPGPNENSDGFVALFGATGTLEFASCLGGSTRSGPSAEALRGVSIGGNGDLYVLGLTSMTDFPLVNPIQNTKLSNARVMTVSQIDPDTSTLVFSTYFGPAASNLPAGASFLGIFPADIEVDSAGNIVVIGSVNSLSYPTLNAMQSNLGVPQNTAQFRDPTPSSGGASDHFVTKLNPVSPAIVFSTFLGGSQNEGGFPSLTIDANNNIYVASRTHATDYPLLNPLAGQNLLAGENKMALSKFSPAGRLAFSTYLGGSTDQLYEQASGYVAVNASGKIILAGLTQSADFPVVDSATFLNGSQAITLSIIDQSGDTDGDGDGVPNAVDPFPADAAEWRDIDGDLTGDNADTDDDGDGTADNIDAFPQKATETADADNDGAGDNLDQFDADASNYFDLDGDSIADFADTDADADGTTTPTDQFDLDATETADSDGDGVRDNADTDDDGDGFPDVYDSDPLDAGVPVLNFETYDARWSRPTPWPDSSFSLPAGADVAWTSADDQSHGGVRSMSSQTITHNEEAAIQIVTDAGFPAGLLRFWYKVDSELNGDVLTFSMDAIDLLTASGNTGWQLFSTPATAGVHTFKWRYEKNGSVSTGDDAAWIDDLTVFDCSLVTDVSLAECNALVALYNQTDGPNWTNQDNWLLAQSACFWEGVTCNGSNHVIALALPNNNMEGELPTQLQNLTFLVDGQLDLLGNAVFTNNAALNSFLLPKTGYSWIDTPTPPISETTSFTTATDLLTDPDPFVDTPFTVLQANDGFDATQDAVVTVVDADITTADMLTLESSNATWNDAADDGVFLGLSAWGDFSAELTVNSLEALPGHSVGLMVRVPTTDGLAAGGPGQDYVTLGVTGDITQIAWSSTDGGTSEGAAASPAARAGLDRPDGAVSNEIHLRIQRNGSVLRDGSVLRNGSVLSLAYRIGSETTWTEVDASPLVREDIDTLELEVGIYQTSILPATAVVDDFSIKSDLILQAGFE